MKIKNFIVYTALPCLSIAKCLPNKNPTALPLDNAAEVKGNPQAPNPLDLIMQKHNQKITKEALIKLFSPDDEKKLLTPLHRSGNHVYQIGHNYILKVCNTARFKETEQEMQDRQKNNNQGALEQLRDFKKIHTDLRDAKHKNPDLPIVDIYAVFEIDGVLPEDRQGDVGHIDSDQFGEIGLLHKDNKDKAPLPLTGVVMQKANVYNNIANGNFDAIPDYGITVLYLQSKGIFPDDKKIDNMGYILTDKIPLYEINGKQYRIVNPAKENGKFMKTVWFDFDFWNIKAHLPQAELQAEVDKLIAQQVILPRERCMNQGQGG